MISTVTTPLLSAAQKAHAPRTLARPATSFGQAPLQGQDVFVPSRSAMASQPVVVSQQPQRPLRFLGYGPTQTERAQVLNALKGSTDQVLRPNYLPAPALVNAVEAALTTGSAIPAELLSALAQQKQEAMNLHHFLLDKPLLTLASTQEDAQAFEGQLKNRVGRLLNEALTEAAGFTPEMRQAFTRYVALSAPVIFSMGFADGVDHAGDVSQLAQVQAKKQGATVEEQLQAAMVGWLHDPKLKGDVSWSNLATHPVVASALSEWVFQDAALTMSLNKTVAGNLANFQQGVREALAINNDSAFVMNNVILANTFKHPLGEAGLAEQVPAVRDWMQKRFKAPSKNETLPVLPEALSTELEALSLSTDLRGISRSVLSLVLGDGVDVEAFYQSVVRGEAQNTTELNRVREVLRQTPSAVESPRVSGKALLAHHDDVDAGKKAALALTVADPLLLSPHKIIESSFEPTLGSRVRSFLQSFAANVAFLPQAQKNIGKAWHKDLLDSMLKAVEELTGRQITSTLAANAPLDDAIEVRQALLQGDAVWTVPQEPSDDPAMKPKNLAELSLKGDVVQARQMANVFKKNYEQALRQSLAMKA